MNTCPDCKNDMACYDKGECLRPTPETDAFYAKLYAPNVPAAMIEIACGDERRKMQSFERQRDEARAEVARLQMELDASCNAEELRQVREENARLRSASVRLFNIGYDAGHNDTVEACFTDIHPSDMDTYHSDAVAEILQDLLTP